MGGRDSHDDSDEEVEVLEVKNGRKKVSMQMLALTTALLA